VIVVDASVIVDILLRSADADQLESRLFLHREGLHAPSLLDVEAAHVMRRYVQRAELPEQHGSDALRILERLPIRRYLHQPLLPRIWALRDSLTAYDATYVALAEGLGATLVTRDAALARAGGHRARVELI
jgi:predicted nucleic acid-binding protein